MTVIMTPHTDLCIEREPTLIFTAHASRDRENAARKNKEEHAMETKISEIASGIYRLSTYVPEIAPPAGFTFNSFLITGDEPLLFHTGLRKMFPLNRAAVSRLMPPEKLCWIAFGHYEADECGAMNEWLAIAPQAQVAHGATGCLVSLNDMADREPRVLDDQETMDLGGKCVRYL